MICVSLAWYWYLVLLTPSAPVLAVYPTQEQCRDALASAKHAYTLTGHAWTLRRD